MDPSILLKKLSDGNTSNILTEVKNSLSGPGHSSLAFKVLVRVSNLCIKFKEKSEPILTDEEASQLTLLCCEAINTDTKLSCYVPFDSRVISAMYNMIKRFHKNDNIACAVKVLNGFLPVLEKLACNMSDADHENLENIVSIIFNLVISANQSIYKEDDKLSPIGLLDLMLQVSLISNHAKSIIHTTSLVRHMSMKYENCNKSSNVEKVVVFNKTLLTKLMTFFHCKLSKGSTKGWDADKFFSVFVPLLWHFLRADICLDSASNLHYIISELQKSVEPLLLHDIHHRECFEFLVKVLNTFLLHVNHTTNEKHFIAELQYLLQIVKRLQRTMSSAFMWALFIGGRAVTCMDKVASHTVGFSSFLTQPVLSIIFEFAKLLAELLPSCCNSVCLSANGENCPYKGDTSLALQTLIAFVDLILKYKKNCKGEFLELFPLIQNSFTSLESILKIASEEKCVKASSMQELLYDNYYRCGNLCYNTSNWAQGQLMFLHCLKYFSGLDTNNSSDNHQKSLQILQRFSVCCEKQGLRKEAKAAILLSVILHLKGDSPHHPFLRSQWCLLQNEDPVNVCTAVQFAERESRLLKSICPGFYLSPQFIPSILLWELSCYAVEKMQSTEICLNAWVALKASKPSNAVLLEGSALALQALYSVRDTVQWYEVISASLPSWLSKVTENERAVALCSMAVHYHMKFLMMAQEHFDENESKVVDACVYPKNPLTVRLPTDVINPHDVCHVTSTFSNLNLIREQTLMDTLDIAVKYWEDSLKAGLKAEHYSIHTIVTASGEYILQVGYLYSLWGYNSGAAKAFELCRKFAKKMGLNELLIQALSGLMNTVEVKKECIAEAERLIEALKDHHKSLYFSKLYYTSRAFQALRTKNYSEGFDALKNVIDCPPTPSTLWCYTYTKLLQASYSTLPKFELDKLHPAEKGNASFGVITSSSFIQDRRLSHSPLNFAAVTHQILASALWIGRNHLWHQMPRAARAFLKPELMIALKLGLATRAAEFICELAFVDLLTENVDGAIDKITDLNSIMKHTDAPIANSPEENGSDEEEEDLTVYELRIKPNKLEIKPNASPELQANLSFIPLMKHGFYCMCYQCRNCSVQNVWLMFCHLQAKIKMLSFFARDSNQLYKDSFSAVKWIFKKLSQSTCLEGILLQQHQVACSEIYMRLSYVDMLVMYGEDQKALNKNEAIQELLKNLKTFENQLQAEAIEQKTCIFNILEQNKKKANELRPSKECATRVFLDKTPERNGGFNTPICPEKKGREPLKLVKTPNQSIQPLTDQQFHTPKAALIVSPGVCFDVKQKSHHISENVSKAPRKNQEPCRSKTEKNQVTSNFQKTLQLEEEEELKRTRNKSNVTQSIPKSKSKVATSTSLSRSSKEKSETSQQSSSTRTASNIRTRKAADKKTDNSVQSVKSKGKLADKTENLDVSENNPRATRSSRLKKI